MRLYAGLEVAIAVLALLVPVFLALATPLLRLAYADAAGGVAFPLLRLLVSLVLIAVPAVAMGATFPVVARWYVPDAAAATRAAGALYAANTVGAALGALLAGFVLLPAVGLRATTWVGVGLNLRRRRSRVDAGAPGRWPNPPPSRSRMSAARRARVAAARPRRRFALAGSGARGSPRSRSGCRGSSR